LHKTLQDATGSSHKWRSRCWQGIYLGHSPMHAGNVALVYNPSTTHVTPQFHVTWDDTFSSVAPLLTPESHDQAIKSLLENTAWMFKDAYAVPSAHHYFVPEATLASSTVINHLADLQLDARPPIGPSYKPVRESQQFLEWKQANGIAAEVFAPHFPVPSGPSSTSLPDR